ncbi:hypothetical protein AC579_2507 [Pseudocercospora musae]|uniref:Uncharacterized protein n=1 Tax=Pseudocercospora musae TaxID=113226 RepID=A0A139I4A1_9PEZI|nr:hypothetical protein AC579_2507 [Pseudocercospora musae]
MELEFMTQALRYGGSSPEYLNATGRNSFKPCGHLFGFNFHVAWTRLSLHTREIHFTILHVSDMGLVISRGSNDNPSVFPPRQHAEAAQVKS